MDFNQFRQTATAPLLLVSDPVASLRWEVSWLAGDARKVPKAAPRPPIFTVSGAIDMLLADEARELGFPQILSSPQGAALWREVVADSRQGGSLISPLLAANAAAAAWRMLHEWDIPWQTLRADPDDHDFEALLDWCRAFQSILLREGWSERSTLVTELVRSAGARPRYDVAAALSRPLAPIPRRLFDQRCRNEQLMNIPVPAVHRSYPLVRTENPRHELEVAAGWVSRRLNDSRNALIAVVVPDVRARELEVESVLGDVVGGTDPAPDGAYGPVWTAHGHSLLSFGAPGAGANALELLLGRGQFEHLSSFLRSPFFPSDERESYGDRSAFEVEFRTELLSRWRFADAMHRGDLQTRLLRALPVSGARLLKSLGMAAGRGPALVPGDWVDLWLQILRALEWQPDACGTTNQVATGWEQALKTFASTSAMVGRIGPARALEEFRRLAEATRIRSPMTLAGVHVLERPEQIGPGYDAVWVTGFTDRQWPASMQLNPLLPARLQRLHQMSRATPELAHGESKAILDRFVASVPEIVFSAPRGIDDEVLRPSRMLPMEEWNDGDVQHAGYARRRIDSRLKRVLPDPVPPVEAGRLTGGTRLLELQASCPVRAFCELRLGAKALERPNYGLPARVRGFVLHRALELLFRPHVGAGSVPLRTIADGIEAAVDRAMADNVPWRQAPWDLITNLEAARAERAISALLDREAHRETVDVVAVESPVTLELDGWSLRGRIDRIDRNADGGVLIVDYKTGSVPPSSAWFSPRLLAPQMPAYAIACTESVAGFVIAALGDGRVEYRATGELPDGFPVAPRPPLTADAWHDQLNVWRVALASLLREFAAGDVRIAHSRPEPAAGPFAPLTRVFGVNAEVPSEDGSSGATSDA